MAILGTIAFISLQGYSRDARDSTRIADIGNIKTSLELYSLETGKFPKPDMYSTVAYSGNILWYQGIIGDNVTTNLKSLNYKPIDPLLDYRYIYSVSNTQKEYNFLALNEGNKLIPKIYGNYNGIFIKANSYIISIPTIITSESLSGTLVLDSNNIKSQVVTNGANIPKIGTQAAQTGGLINFPLTVTGILDKNSTNAEKISVIQTIQSVYTGTSLVNQSNISYILNQTSNQQLIELANVIILHKNPSVVTSITEVFSCPVGYEGNGLAITTTSVNDAIYSPDGNFIVYTNMGDLNKLYKKSSSDSLNGTAITIGNAFDPNYSPDGNWIIYESNGDIKRKSSSDSLNGIAITNGNYWSIQPIYSPDGNSIIYTRGGVRTLYKKSSSDSLNGTAITTVLSHDAVYSPDGNSIVYTNGTDGSKLYKKSSNDSLNGTAITTVLSQRPDYSPDGNWIIYKNTNDAGKLYKKCANF